MLTTDEVGAAPVMNGDALAGVFSERDSLGKVAAQGLDPERTRVREIMTREPQTIEAGAPLVRASAEMIEGRFRHPPVTGDDGRVIAMLSMRDVPPEHRIMHQQRSAWTSKKGGFTLRPRGAVGGPGRPLRPSRHGVRTIRGGSADPAARDF